MVEPGTRVVVRSRIPGGYTDTLGTVISCDRLDCVLQTRIGPVTLTLSSVILAKSIPPPPVRRARG